MKVSDANTKVKNGGQTELKSMLKLYSDDCKMDVKRRSKDSQTEVKTMLKRSRNDTQTMVKWSSKSCQTELKRTSDEALVML